MKLNNGVGLYKVNGKRHIIEAHFRNPGSKLEIVFEGLNRKECLQYCHRNGLRMMPFDRWFVIVNASFRKVNAKTPYNEDDYRVGTIYN